jgi:hypothetical protein
MGLLTMPSEKRLHHVYVAGDQVVAVLSEQHKQTTGGLYRVVVPAPDVAAAIWRIAAGRAAG